MQPGDRLICALLEPLAVGRRFRKWPLHVTVLPWFRLEEESDRIAAGLRTAYTGIGSFDARTGREVRLGPNKNRPARVLDPAGDAGGSFPELERRTRRYLHKKRAWLVDETTQARRPYLPHVTYQAGRGRQGDGAGRLEAGKTLHCDSVYMVEQKGDHKEVVAKLPLH